MTSILISSDEPRIGEQLARQLAAEEGFAYVGPSLLDEVAERTGVPREILAQALDGAGSRPIAKPKRALLLSHIQSATLDALMKDNTVCVGLAAHLHVKGVSHCLHLRVLMDPEKRAAELAQERSTSVKKIARTLDKERLRRSRWSIECFGVDETDPALYDIVVQLKQISPDRVIEIVRDTVKLRGFATMTYSTTCLANLLRASQLREALLPKYPDIRVQADGDRAIVHVKCSSRAKPKVVSGIKDTAKALKNVSLVEVHAVKTLRDVAAGHERDPRTFLEG